jgi:hypothetical protein
MTLADVYHQRGFFNGGDFFVIGDQKPRERRKHRERQIINAKVT